MTPRAAGFVGGAAALDDAFERARAALRGVGPGALGPAAAAPAPAPQAVALQAAARDMTAAAGMLADAAGQVRTAAVNPHPRVLSPTVPSPGPGPGAGRVPAVAAQAPAVAVAASSVQAGAVGPRRDAPNQTAPGQAPQAAALGAATARFQRAADELSSAVRDMQAAASVGSQRLGQAPAAAATPTPRPTPTATPGSGADPRAGAAPAAMPMPIPRPTPATAQQPKAAAEGAAVLPDVADHGAARAAGSVPGLQMQVAATAPAASPAVKRS